MMKNTNSIITNTKILNINLKVQKEYKFLPKNMTISLV